MPRSGGEIFFGETFTEHLSLSDGAAKHQFGLAFWPRSHNRHPGLLILVAASEARGALLADCQRPFLERPRPRKVTLVPKQQGELPEARRRIGMLGAEHLLADRQCTLVERPRPHKVTLVPK
jgi:hypothetical protein